MQRRARETRVKMSSWTNIRGTIKLSHGIFAAQKKKLTKKFCHLKHFWLDCVNLWKNKQRRYCFALVSNTTVRRLWRNWWNIVEQRHGASPQLSRRQRQHHFASCCSPQAMDYIHTCFKHIYTQWCIIVYRYFVEILSSWHRVMTNVIYSQHSGASFSNWIEPLQK